MMTILNMLLKVVLVSICENVRENQEIVFFLSLSSKKIIKLIIKLSKFLGLSAKNSQIQSLCNVYMCFHFS